MRLCLDKRRRLHMMGNSLQLKSGFICFHAWLKFVFVVLSDDQQDIHKVIFMIDKHGMTGFISPLIVFYKASITLRIPMNKSNLVLFTCQKMVFYNIYTHVSKPHRCTASDYSSGIFKLFMHM